MPVKRPKNLLLDVGALRYGEAYANHRATTLPQLVEDFLTSLPSITEPSYRVQSVVEQAQLILRRNMTTARSSGTAGR